MTVRRYAEDLLVPEMHNLEHLPWADYNLLSIYRSGLPTGDQIEEVDNLTASPIEFISNESFVIRALENALGNMLTMWLLTIEKDLDEVTAKALSRSAGKAHASLVFGTFVKGQRHSGDSAAKIMAKYQDTAHSMRGPRHATALFARYDDTLVEVVRTDDSMGGAFSEDKAGKQSLMMRSFLDGMVEGYQSIQPELHHVDEIVRTTPRGIETVHRFWYTGLDTLLHSFRE